MSQYTNSSSDGQLWFSVEEPLRLLLLQGAKNVLLYQGPGEGKWSHKSYLPSGPPTVDYIDAKTQRSGLLERAQVICRQHWVLSGDSPDSHHVSRQASGGVARHHHRLTPFSNARHETRTRGGSQDQCHRRGPVVWANTNTLRLPPVVGFQQQPRSTRKPVAAVVRPRPVLLSATGGWAGGCWNRRAASLRLPVVGRAG